MKEIHLAHNCSNLNRTSLPLITWEGIGLAKNFIQVFVTSYGKTRTNFLATQYCQKFNNMNFVAARPMNFNSPLIFMLQPLSFLLQGRRI